MNGYILYDFNDGKVQAYHLQLQDSLENNFEAI